MSSTISPPNSNDLIPVQEERTLTIVDIAAGLTLIYASSNGKRNRDGR